MKRKAVQITVCALAATFTFAGAELSAEAVAGGMTSGLINNVNGSTIAESARITLQREMRSEMVTLESPEILTRALVELAEEVQFRNLVIAQVNNYVNVRSLPGEDGEIVGKLYDDSVGTFLEEENGWYKINSGNVTGYVKAEYCVTGEAAVELAKQVRDLMATVTTQTLFVRQEPTTESGVIGMVPEADELLVLEEVDGWVKVDVEEGTGWVSKEYVNLHSEFVHAESKEEEAARLAKEAEARRKAQEAARKAAQSNSGNKTSSTSQNNTATSQSTIQSNSNNSDMGRAVADYALKFLGNPYVYGGTSLTKGADCSGFVQSVYANFGVSLPRTSGEQRSSGSAVDGLTNAKPGDLVCYSGHIGIYIGDGKIVHASSSKTGIITSRADYRSILAIRRIF